MSFKNSNLTNCKFVNARISGANFHSTINPNLQNVADESGMHVFVKTLTGLTFSLFARSDNTILALKEKIHNGVGIPTDQQRLIFAGRQLDNEFPIAHYPISNENTLHLVLRLRGD